MQDFANFEKVFYFFVRDSIDPDYVNTIDANPDKESTLTASIRDFHEMRQHLCRLILNHMGLAEPLQLFVNARGVVQYNRVPQGSRCIFGDKTLRPQDGTLIVVDGQHPFTFDKRFKTIVFYFWYIVHLPDELITNAMKKEISVRAMNFCDTQRQERDLAAQGECRKRLRKSMTI